MIADNFPDVIPARDEETNINKWITAHEDERAITGDKSLQAIAGTKLNQVTDAYPSFDEDATYQDGDIVAYDGRNYQLIIEDDDVDEVSGVFPDEDERWNEYQNEALDNIGALFGDVGRRRGRSDPVYQQYLGALVSAFAGSGEKRNIRRAVTAAILLQRDGDIDQLIENIEIEEYVEDLEYDIIINDWDGHDAPLVLEVADIAEPSGVTLRELKYIMKDRGVAGEATAVELESIVRDLTQASDVITDVEKEPTVDLDEDTRVLDLAETQLLDTQWNVGNWGDTMTWGERVVPTFTVSIEDAYFE